MKVKLEYSQYTTSFLFVFISVLLLPQTRRWSVGSCQQGEHGSAGHFKSTSLKLTLKPIMWVLYGGCRRFRIQGQSVYSTQLSSMCGHSVQHWEAGWGLLHLQASWWWVLQAPPSPWPWYQEIQGALGRLAHWPSWYTGRFLHWALLRLERWNG